MKENTDHILTLEQQLDTPAGTPDGEKAPLSVQLVDNLAQWVDLHEEWNSLAEASSATVYQTHEWLSLWWKHYGSKAGDSIYILVFRKNEQLVGIAPMYAHVESFLGNSLHRRLALLGHGAAFGTSFGMFSDDGPSDYLDIIALPDFATEICSSLLAHLMPRRHEWDEIEFVNASQNSLIVTKLLPKFGALGFSCKSLRGEICPQLRTPASFEEFLRSVSGSVRRRLTQAQRAAREEGMYSIQTAHSFEEHEKAVDNMRELHQHRWNRIGYPGLFADQRFRNFQDDVLRSFFANGWLWCKTALADGTCVAGRLAFSYNSTFYDYLSGFDDQSPAAKRRPGLGLLLEMIADAIHEGFEKIDFLRGDEQYKFELTNDACYNWNILIANRRSGFSLRLLLHHTVKLFSFMQFLIRKELSLLRVQRQQHSFPKDIAHYVRFRAPRFTKKITMLFGRKKPSMLDEKRESNGD